MTGHQMAGCADHGAPIVATAADDDGRPVASIAADGCVAWHVAWTERSCAIESRVAEWSAIARAVCASIEAAMR